MSREFVRQIIAWQLEGILDTRATRTRKSADLIKDILLGLLKIGRGRIGTEYASHIVQSAG